MKKAKPTIKIMVPSKSRKASVMSKASTSTTATPVLMRT